MLLKYSVEFPYNQLPPGFEALEGTSKTACVKVIAFVHDPGNPTQPLLNQGSDAVKAGGTDCDKWVGAVVGNLRGRDFKSPEWIFEIEIPDEAILDKLCFQNCFICQARIYDCETQAIFNQKC